MSISPLAIVGKEARIGRGAVIDPFATVADDVVLGSNTWIGSHAIIMDGCRIGDDCKIYPGAILGGAPQDLKYAGEETTVEILEGAVIREYCTINRGTKASGKTLIGRNALIMAYAHIAHDCHIDRNAVVANAVNLAGHVQIGEHAIVGGMSAVQQFVTIGRFSFIGGGTLVRKDVPPFIKAAREPLSYVGVNTVGLQRKGFDRDDILAIKEIYRNIFIRFDNIQFAVDHLTESFEDNEFKTEILRFIEQSRRGVIRGFKQSGNAY